MPSMMVGSKTPQKNCPKKSLSCKWCSTKRTGTWRTHERKRPSRCAPEGHSGKICRIRYVIALEHERDDALSRLRSTKGTEQRFQSLLAEKNDLQQKRAAEEKVTKLNESDPGTVTKLAEMGQRLAQLQQQFTETQNRNYYLAARAGELDVELEHASAELQTAKLAEVNSEDSAQLASRNELLRNIVVLERQEEARLEEARKLILGGIG